MDPPAVQPPPGVLHGGDDLPAPLADLARRVRLVALRIDELDLVVFTLALEELPLFLGLSGPGRGFVLESLPLLVAVFGPKVRPDSHGWPPAGKRPRPRSR